MAFAVRSLLLLAMLTATAHAETITELEDRGAALARDGHFTEAIEAFKAADLIQVRAAHACLIALAYTRRELWPQAELFLARCHARATPDDPLPDWVPAADAQLVERLAVANVATIDIHVTPDTAPVRLTVSSFASDESLDGRTIHLPFGQHVVTATAAGFETVRVPVDVVDKDHKDLAIALQPVHVEPPPVVATEAPPSRLPLYLVAGGGGVAAVGLAVHLFVLEPTRSDLQAASTARNKHVYDDLSPSFDHKLEATLALYGVGAALIAAGLVLNYVVYPKSETPVRVSAQPIRGGAMLGVSVGL